MTANPQFSLPDKFAKCIDFSNPNDAYLKTKVTFVPEGDGASTTEIIVNSAASGTFDGLIKTLRIKNSNPSSTYYLQLRENNASGNFIDIITLPPSKEIYLDSYWSQAKIDQMVWWGVSTNELTVNLAPIADISLTWRYVAN